MSDGIKLTDTWEFDNHSSPNGKVFLFDMPLGNKLIAEDLHIETHIDQWGTWITLSMGEELFTIGQEDGTRSFLQAMIDGLEKLKNLSDFQAKSPTHNAY